VHGHLWYLCGFCYWLYLLYCFWSRQSLYVRPFQGLGSKKGNQVGSVYRIPPSDGRLVRYCQQGNPPSRTSVQGRRKRIVAQTLPDSAQVELSRQHRKTTQSIYFSPRLWGEARSFFLPLSDYCLYPCRGTSSWHLSQPILLQSQGGKTSQQEALCSTTSFSRPKGSTIHGEHQPVEHI